MINDKKYGYLLKRQEYFLNLLEIGEDFLISFENEENIFTSWIPISSIPLNEVCLNTRLHREILLNEWVFDIDGVDWGSVRNLALELENVFDKYGIPFNRWSSGRWLHYHIFIDFKNLQNEKYPQIFLDLYEYHFNKLLNKKLITIDEFVGFIREVNRSIPLIFIEEVGKSVEAHIDLNKFISIKTMIRAEGSFNYKGKGYKSYLEELPEKQPIIKPSWNVVFPEEIKVWKPKPFIYDKLFSVAYWDYVRPKYETQQKNLGFKGMKKTYWIENLLNIPISDGRKIAIYRIIGPYLINVKNLSVIEALNRIENWLTKCMELRKSDISRNWIKAVLRNAKRKGILPMSPEKFLSEYYDVVDAKEIISLILRKNK